MQEMEINTLKKLNNSTTFDYSNNSWNLNNENFENKYPKAVSLNVTENKKQCYLETANVLENRCQFDMINNLESFDIHHNEVVKPQKCTPNKVCTRTVPNILKNKLKQHRSSQLNSTETETAQISLNSATMSDSLLLENKCTKIESKNKRLPHRRKQEYRSTNVWHEFPSCNIYSFTDDKEEILSENLSVELENATLKKKLKDRIKKCKKYKMPAAKTEQKENLFSSTSCDLSMDSVSEFCTSPPSQVIEPRDSQDPVDFSSNEIFSKYNYECYGMKLNYFTESIIDSNEIYNSLNTIYEKDYDINSNEIDTNSIGYCFPSQNEQNEEVALVNESLTFSEYCINDTIFFDSKTSDYSSNLYCERCLEDCVSNWITTTGTRNHVCIKDKFLTQTLNENSINMANSADHQVYISCSDLHAAETDIDSNNSVLREEYNENKFLITDAELFPQYAFENIELSLPELTVSYDENDNERNTFEELASTIKRRECDAIDDLNDISLFEPDYDIVLRMSEKQVKNGCNEDTVQTQANKRYNKNKKEFQCLLCPLTFSNARSMAIHQAAAHGGMYVILCESCGRLFNRKYHFNRHFIHCGRLKEPYNCDMCMRKYRHKSSLIHHLKITHHVHYTRNRLTTFTCSVCKKVYSKFGALENHMKRHKRNVY